jgi:hypothetical protein
MKKSILMLLVLASALSPTCLSANPDVAQSRDLAPEVTVQEPVHDFGTLMEGEKAIFTFVVENTGSAPLVIEKIKTTCGCTTADYTRGEIAPGGEGEVTLHVNTKGYGGRKIDKSATVYTNAPKSNAVKLRMTGKVAVYADIEPESIKLVGPPGETVRAVVRIMPTEAFPFRIVGEPETGKNFYRCALEEKDGAYILTAENLATEDTVYFDTVTLKTDSPDNPEIRIRVVGKIKTETGSGKGS